MEVTPTPQQSEVIDRHAAELADHERKKLIDLVKERLNDQVPSDQHMERLKREAKSIAPIDQLLAIIDNQRKEIDADLRDLEGSEDCAVEITLSPQQSDILESCAASLVAEEKTKLTERFKKKFPHQLPSPQDMEKLAFDAKKIVTLCSRKQSLDRDEALQKGARKALQEHHALMWQSLVDQVRLKEAGEKSLREGEEKLQRLTERLDETRSSLADAPHPDIDLEADPAFAWVALGVIAIAGIGATALWLHSRRPARPYVIR